MRGTCCRGGLEMMKKQKLRWWLENAIIKVMNRKYAVQGKRCRNDSQEGDVLV
jgi:hypothetical protein